MVLRHLTLLSRPSSIDGVVWEDKHEPVVLFDLSVFLSCLLFLLISVTLYLCDYLIGSLFFVVVTTFSALSDGVYFNHYWLDTGDRITAVLGFFFMGYAAFCAQLKHKEVAELLEFYVAAKLLTTIVLSLMPLWFLNNSRKNPVRSEKWRWFHIRWHISAAFGGSLAVLLGNDMLEEVATVCAAKLE